MPLTAIVFMLCIYLEQGRLAKPVNPLNPQSEFAASLKTMMTTHVRRS